MAKPPLSQLRQRTTALSGAKHLTLQQAQDRTKRFPRDPLGWKELGRHLRAAEQWTEARQALEKAADIAPDDHEIWLLLGQTAASASDDKLAQAHFEHALELRPDDPDTHRELSDIMARRGDDTRALTHADKVLAARPEDIPALSRKAQILTRLRRFEDAIPLCERLIARDPRNRSTHWNDLGNIHRELGRLAEAEACYGKGAALTTTDPVPLSNRLTLMHYMPDRSAADILQACKQWSARFAPPVAVQRPIPADRSPGRKLRIGMFSDGFRQHPVGAMTTPALEHLVKLGVEIYAYTTSNVVDSVTRRIMAIATRWTPIATVDNEELAQRIRDDEIDILIDLSGHNAGNRIRTMTLQPAPILVKWVGGLINTTGVQAIDYLISDGIESPPGSDPFYTEKLIRMPDDYICYMPPRTVPNIGELPARKNGYVTFGCFNNPTKINQVVLAEWAKLLHSIPNSRLFLKGSAFGSDDLRERTWRVLREQGIDADRVRMEGHSPHYELFQRYNEVDVALDPWPYSGGLTTCEALLMGVPVVTLPGPTFAGRHSATHLVNAGLPELVAQDWEQYRARAMELVANLENLATIRSHLRQALLTSPVCDGKRFARNLAHALRAIWQRYCEGKAPAALSFTPEGQTWFDGDAEPMILVHPQPEPDGEASFDFSFQGKIVTLDHGGSLTESDRLGSIANLPALQTIAIDPASRIKNSEQLKRMGVLQDYHSHVALGDGQAATLYACLDASLSGTLEPLASDTQFPLMRQAATVLAKLPIITARLDDIHGLEKVDWLALDHVHDNLKILQGAKRLLTDTLVVQIRLFFVDVFHNQPDLSTLATALSLNGFRLLRLDEAKYHNYFPTLGAPRNYAGAQLMNAEAIFVPTEERIKQLDPNQRLKLAFILHSAYGLPDLAYKVLELNDKQAAMRYLTAGGWVAPARSPAKSAAESSTESPAESVDAKSTVAVTDAKRFVHICYNNMHVQGFLELLTKPALAGDFIHQVFIEKTRSIPGYDNDIKDHANASFFDRQTELQTVIERCLASDVQGIFIHGLFFEWQKQLVRQIGRRKKITWILWGGDLYNPIRTGRPIHDVAEHIHAVATGTDGDYQIFRDTYGDRPRLQFAYPGETDFETIDVPATKSKVIFVGNSGDSSNRHIEILDALARKSDIGGYEIVLPVSYNLHETYEKELRAHIDKLGLQKQTRLLTDFIPPREYFAMLAQAEFFITAHHRQQAMGNLVASLYFGNRTILRRNITVNDTVVPNPGWNLLTTKMDVRPTPFEDFVEYKRLADIPPVTDDALASQRAGISQYYGRHAVARLLQAQFAEAARF